MKSEPDTFSIDELERLKKTVWEGVRNYQARNYMLHDMQVGDPVLFYHSNCNPPAIVGLAKVSKLGLIDPTQFDKKSEYYDPKSSPEAPRWKCVEIEFKRKLPKALTLPEIKNYKALTDMVLLNNSRLSVQPVSQSEYKFIMKILNEKETLECRM
jgi:predicted RNA-binding protein with PUA-like domain